MARPRKNATGKSKRTPAKQAQENQVAEAEMKHPFAAVIVVLVLVVAFTVIAYQAFITGKLFVKVAVADGQSTDPVLVCVYQGDQTDALSALSTENAPQAQAALLVQPDAETRIEGSWHGPYTIAVVDPEGLADAATNVQTAYVGRGETHVGFLIDRAAETSANVASNAEGVSRTAATGTEAAGTAPNAASSSAAFSANVASTASSANAEAAASGASGADASAAQADSASSSAARASER
jgi:hypothetical protein